MLRFHKEKKQTSLHNLLFFLWLHKFSLPRDPDSERKNAIVKESQQWITSAAEQMSLNLRGECCHMTPHKTLWFHETQIISTKKLAILSF